MKSLKRIQWLIFFLALSGLLLSACGQEEAPLGSAGQDDEIAESVLDYLAGQGKDTRTFEVQLQEVAGGFARVQIISTDPEVPGSFTGFLQEVEGNWRTLLVSSSFEPNQLRSLGIPEGLLPFGWSYPAELVLDKEADCPVAGEGSLALSNAAHGYCLLYPAGYTVEYPNPHEMSLVVGSIMNHIDPRVDIIIEPASGRTAAQAADEWLEGFELAQFSIERKETVLGGQEAIMLDHMPGQDLNRQLFVVQGDVLYHFFFAPFDESSGATYTQMEDLYGLVTGSFMFQARAAEK